MAFSIAGNMGIGALLDQDVVYKRKFRWTFYVEPYCATLAPINPWFVKLASRPNITVEEYELNFLNEKTWIPGKVSYETMSVTYMDVAAKRPESAALYNWLGAVYQFNTTTRLMGSNINDYGARGTLVLYSGCGEPLETWVFGDLWPTGINFTDLDQSSSDTVDIELTLRYSRFTYTANCGSVAFPSCCTGCGT